MARPITKAEQAARDAVAAYVADPSWQNRNAAWHAVFAVSLSDGWWHRATACVWFAVPGVGGAGIGDLQPVGLGAEVTIQELRYRLDIEPRPPEKPPEGDEANRDRVWLRQALTRVKYHEQVARDIRAKFATLERIAADLKTEVGQLDVPNLDTES